MVFKFYAPITFVDDMLVGSDDTLDNIFPQPPNGFNDNFIFIVVDRINGKTNTGNFALDHFLNGDSDANFKVIVFIFDLIKKGTGSEKAGPTGSNLVDDVSFANDIEKSITLTGKGGIGTILSGGRGADSHRYVFKTTVITEFFVGSHNVKSNIFRDWGTFNHFSDFS